MSKQEFLDALREGLTGLPKEDIEERISFYGEIIDDRIEEGATEEEAVLAIGSVEAVIEQIIAQTPLTRIAKETIKPKRRLRAWEIVLLAVGSPLWLSLAAVAFVLLVTLYAVLWSVIAVLWSVFGALIACGAGGAAAGGIFFAGGHAMTGLAVIGACLVCAGLGIFLFFGCRAATKGTAWLTGRIALGVKRCFMKKEKQR